MAKKKPPPLDDELRGLYQGPLGEFVAARRALARRLKQAGDPRHAEVGELRKPSLSAWAVDRLFALEPRAMAALVGAGERARARQRRSGRGGDAAALGELVATIRGEIERLTGRGVEILTESERAPGEAIVERLRTNLQALALDPGTAPVAARGWLDEDLPPPGFEHLAALQVAAAGARTAPRATPQPAAAPAAKGKAGTGGKATVHHLDEVRRDAAERRKREERERRERVERARAEVTRAENDAAAARRAVERAGRDAERAESEAAEAERRAEAARARAKAARRSAGEAEEKAAAAEAIAQRAHEALARAERS